MKYLLDTDIVVDHLRRRKSISEDVLGSGAAISLITLGELIYGSYKSDNPKKSLTVLRESLYMLGLEIENLNEVIIAQFGRIKAELERFGSRLEDFDLLIAATAQVLNLTLVTRNINHFKRIKELKIKDISRL